MTSERVDLGDDLYIPSGVVVQVRNWTHDVDIQIVLVDGRLSAGEVTVKRRDMEGSPVVTGEVLRDVPVATLVSEAGYAVHHVKERFDGGGFSVEPAWPSKEEGAYIAQHGLDDVTLRIVARIYRVAYLVGKPPTKTVETVLGLPRSTVGRWIAAARDKGYLGMAAGPGKAGGTRKKELNNGEHQEADERPVSGPLP